MAHHGRFVIRNNLSGSLILCIEPEGVFFPLDKGEEVSVSDVFTASPVTVKVSKTDKGAPILSIWPGDGEVTVTKNGVNVFDLLSELEGQPPG